MNLVAWHTARKMSERTALPDLDTLNHEALKALIVAQHAQILSKDEQILHRDEQLASRDEEIERLKMLIAKLRRMQFGRKSEKLDRQIEQLELRIKRRNVRGSHCRRICRVRRARFCRSRKHVRTAAAS
jgi:predicted RecB family endonuclease